MAAPMKSQLPLDLDLDGGFIIQFTALSPTDASVVAGVSVSNASLLVTNVSGGDLVDAFSGPFMLVPGPGA